MKKFLVVLSVLVLVPFFALAFTVTMVTDTGGLGDQSFNDGTWRGVEMIAEEFDDVIAQVVQSNEQADYVPNLSKAAEQSDVVLSVGFMMTDALLQVAPQYPNVKFIGIDFDLSAEGLPNVHTYTFKEHESAFLAGFLAAAMTKTDTVGFIGGIPVPAVVKFQIGYQAGVKYYNKIHGKNVQVLVGYTQNFTDSQKGKTMTEAQYSQGADIVFAAAGLCGLGTFEAAKAYGEGFYAIGVDVDQDHLAEGKILTSAMKGITQSAYMGVLDAYEGYFEAGHDELGFAENGVQLSEMKYTKEMIPEWLLVELAGLESLAKSGDFLVPASEEELEVF